MTDDRLAVFADIGGELTDASGVVESVAVTRIEPLGDERPRVSLEVIGDRVSATAAVSLERAHDIRAALSAALGGDDGPAMVDGLVAAAERAVLAGVGCDTVPPTLAAAVFNLGESVRALTGQHRAELSIDAMRKLGADAFVQLLGEDRARDLLVLVRGRRKILGVEVPIRFDNPNNGSQTNRRARAAKRKAQRDDVAWQLKPLKGDRPRGAEYVVTFTRWIVGGGVGMDGDGLAAALKPLRDEVAAAMGIDDGPASGLHWVYRQAPAPDRNHGVAVLVELLL